MGEARAQAISAETRERLATAASTGRLLLATLARWLDVEACPAMTALNADLRGLSDDDANAITRSIARRQDPAVLADAMVTIIDAIGRLEGMTAADWRLVRRLAREWLRG